MNIESELVEKILLLEDFDDASRALVELKYINKEKAKKLAYEILVKKQGDVYLQATAFDIYYSIDRTEGLKYIENFLDEVDLILFRSMIECFTEDSELNTDNDIAKSITNKMNTKIEKLTPEEKDIIKLSINWFKESYGIK